MKSTEYIIHPVWVCVRLFSTRMKETFSSPSSCKAIQCLLDKLFTSKNIICRFFLLFSRSRFVAAYVQTGTKYTNWNLSKETMGTGWKRSKLIKITHHKKMLFLFYYSSFSSSSSSMYTKSNTVFVVVVVWCWYAPLISSSYKMSPSKLCICIHMEWIGMDLCWWWQHARTCPMFSCSQFFFPVQKFERPKQSVCVHWKWGYFFWKIRTQLIFQIVLNKSQTICIAKILRISNFILLLLMFHWFSFPHVLKMKMKY